MKVSTNLISTPDHTLLALHLDILLLLGVGQRPRNTKQEGTGAYDPQCPTAEQQTGLCEGCDRVDSVEETAAMSRRNDVLQSVDTLV